jgi:hypothetical protein
MGKERIDQLKQLIPDALVTKVAAAAQADHTFRDAFLSDPKGAYRTRFGEELLPGEAITVETSNDGATFFYLPRLDAKLLVHREAKGGERLSDEDLEVVTGGNPLGTSSHNKLTEPPPGDTSMMRDPKNKD